MGDPILLLFVIGLALTRSNQVRGHRTGSCHSGHLEWRNTPGTKTQAKPKAVYTQVS